jgi:hypothetical protein
MGDVIDLHQGMVQGLECKTCANYLFEFHAVSIEHNLYKLVCSPDVSGCNFTITVMLTPVPDNIMELVKTLEKEIQDDGQ